MDYITQRKPCEYCGKIHLDYACDKQIASIKIIDNSDLLNHYCHLFADADKETVTYELKAHIQKNYEMNTLGARLINTMIHQYFIKGKLIDKEVKEISFQKKLSLT